MTTLTDYRKRVGGVLLALLLASGCASTAETGTSNDPLESYNRVMFDINNRIDKAVLKPVAQGYQTITPQPVNDSVSNFFSNLGDVVVLANDLLQLKFEQAAMDTSRIVYNSTFGVLGMFDVASSMDLPKHNEDFGQTLGYWGVGEGYYLVLPLLGHSTTRDAPALIPDALIAPLSQVQSPTQEIMRTVDVIDTRAGLLRVERAFSDAALDPYAFQREAYLQRRRSLVHDGNPPRPAFDDEFEDRPPFDDEYDDRPPFEDDVDDAVE